MRCLNFMLPEFKCIDKSHGNLVKKQILIQQVWEGPRFCISISLPGAEDHATGQQAAPGTARV